MENNRSASSFLQSFYVLTKGKHGLWTVRTGAALDTNVSSDNLSPKDIRNLERLVSLISHSV